MCLFAQGKNFVYALYAMNNERLAHQFAELYMLAHNLYL